MHENTAKRAVAALESIAESLRVVTEEILAPRRVPAAPDSDESSDAAPENE